MQVGPQHTLNFAPLPFATTLVRVRGMKRLLFCLPLMACAAMEPAAPAMPPLPAAVEDTCNAGRYPFLIGADRDTLERTLILQPVRIITPGQAVTMDFLPTRLNIALNESDRVVRLSCG